MGRLLEQISSSRDIRSLTFKQLNELAGEIRQVLINTVSKTGGHLAPNLGVVELTLGLHRVFHSPVDKIIWDVGHQSYVHKLITGRYKEFYTLRQFGGISGFPRPSESVHDAFGTGHSSTSISAALGMAIARDLKGEKYSVVAVIGDGAMTGGIAFEALNHAGHLKCNLIVVLNDNEMSIAQNVGAMSGYLTRLRTDPMYSRGKEEIEQLLRRIPIGSALLRLGERVKDSLKYLVVPGMIFEELGFTYLGPVDGHDLRAITTVLQHARARKGPVLVHVLTKKGKGYSPAESNPDRFHGIGAFDVATGEAVKKSNIPTYTEVFGRTMVKLAREFDNMLAITAAMTGGTGLTEFARLYPKRFFDVGIAEQHAVTLAAGMATGGFRPVVAIYSTFLQRAYDQILHDVCLQNLPVTFAIDRAGIVGEDGATHHGLFDFSYLRPIPNMVIMAPKDENELQHMLYTALSHPGPAAVRYPRSAGTGCRMDDSFKIIPLGRAEVLRDGTEVTLLAVGSMVCLAVKAAEILAGHGIDAAVINARFVKPLDKECILRYARRTREVFTLEENVLQGGFGSAVQELLSSCGERGVSVHCFGIPDSFVEHGNRALLLARYGLTVEQVVRAVLERFAQRRHPKKLKVVSEKA
ncbi:MAG: 1-deoxy-D-xylulose-5-phosphate synthase [Pelotomaculum sp.]|uniref:1-deoxy-D-xylulose-5-phosphate synthase n=1 Tax=Pelotomaculum thermopropionicum (strain DSM 13744 / JCM 10971 / SI) TaxID=370438 RepID=DXS_PELTS|nr:RecName: Full=1-deoxy-D-xylulose-5-phosphate synthase; AltName: Full=1-deoxyxylulose-5-phosphate synthase; Short=DXP synthase; Short=DXPS [Pelotomaculum thermopropionicum SI]NPV72380.1 1-deoxy-D-xylulose-5-phosphate synthase [Pelotomaculum sp.]BAF59377.1 deoxyxylulose-5-phosphate synthase [Pelotomaculum thermopropionicum SI]